MKIILTLMMIGFLSAVFADAASELRQKEYETASSKYNAELLKQKNAKTITDVEFQRKVYLYALEHFDGECTKYKLMCDEVVIMKAYYKKTFGVEYGAAKTVLPQLAEGEKNYKPDTCEWVSDMPKRIAFGPGCGEGKKLKMCVGYVVCEQKEGEGKFIRMSTCSEGNCGEGKDAAVSCTKENGYGSRKPKDEVNFTVSATMQAIMIKDNSTATEGQ